MKKEHRMASEDTKNNLVLGLDTNGIIIQFDKECQQLTGYSRTDVLNKKISEILIPTSFITQWNNIFSSAIKKEDIVHFEIPLQTFNGEEVPISWSMFPLGSNKRDFRNMCLIGKIIGKQQHKKSDIMLTENNIKKRIIFIQDNNKNNDFQNKDYKIKIPPVLDKSDIDLKDESKEYFIKNSISNTIPEPKENKKDNTEKKNNFIFHKSLKHNSNRQKKSSHSEHSPVSKKLFLIRSANNENNSEQSEPINKTINDLSKKYEELMIKLKELEKKDRKLERKNKVLEKKLQHWKTSIEKSKNIQIEKPFPDNKLTLKNTKKDSASFTKMSDFFQNHLRINTKRRQFEQRLQALNEREKELNKLESQLVKDRKIHNTKIAEFTAWKEKLLSLEQEIENRRRDIEELENSLRDNLTSSSLSKSDVDTLSQKLTDGSSQHDGTQEYREIFDKIPNSVAVIQRSIIKQINTSFSELIGFHTDEIVEKSLFDFIAPEGLADIEKYYLGRLKGSSNSTYETIFLTKDDTKIPVEVSVKPTTYNGEKAELAVIKDMNYPGEGGEGETEDTNEAASTETGEVKQSVVDVAHEIEEDDEQDSDIGTAETDEQKDDGVENTEKKPEVTTTSEAEKGENK